MFRQLKRIFTITLAILITVSFSFDSVLFPISSVEKAYAGGSDEKTAQRVGKETIMTDYDVNAYDASSVKAFNQRSTVFDNKLYAMVFKTGFYSGAAVEQLFLKYVPAEYENASDEEKEKHALYRRINPNFISQSTNYRMDEQYLKDLDDNATNYFGLVDLYNALATNAYKQNDISLVAAYNGMAEIADSFAYFYLDLYNRMNSVLENRSKYENNWEGSYLQIQNTVPTDGKALENISIGRQIFKRDYKFNPTADAIRASLNVFEKDDPKIAESITAYETAVACYNIYKALGDAEKAKNNVRQSDYYYVLAREQLLAKQNAILSIEKRKKEIIFEQTGRKTNNITVSKSVKEYGSTDNAFSSDNTTTIVFNFDFDKFALLDVSVLMKEASTGGGRIDTWSLESWDIYRITDTENMSIQMYSNVSDSSFVQFKGYKIYSYVSDLDGLSVSSAALLQDNDGENINLIRMPVYGKGIIAKTAGNTMITQDEDGNAVQVTTEGKPTLLIDKDSYTEVTRGSITEQLYGAYPELFPRLVKVEYPTTVTDSSKYLEDNSKDVSLEAVDIMDRFYANYDEDKYTFELSLTDVANGGFEELNKWPLEPRLDFYEYLYADIQYYDGTLLDGAPKLKTIKIPVITNAVLKAAEEYTLSNNIVENSTDSENGTPVNPTDRFVSYANDGKILSFAQQGEKLVFDALLPSCINIVGVELSYEASIDNFSDDQININAVKVYRNSQVESVTYNFPFLNAKINLKNGEEPLYSYTSGNYNGVSVYVDSDETIELNPSGHADLYPERDIEDMYLVKIETSPAKSAGTTANVGLALKYVDTKGESHYTTEYSLKESMEDYYGYWIGEVEENNGETTDYTRENAAFRIGGRAGGEFCMLVEAQNLSHFTGFKAEITDGEDDDWQIESMKIVRLTSLGDRIARTIAQSNEEYAGGNTFESISDVEEINGISIDRYYTRDYEGDVLIGCEPGDPGYQIRVLVQPDSVKEYDFVSHEEKEDVEYRDYSEYEQFMDYSVACTDLKFTKNDRKYTIKVTVPENSTQGVRDDGCGSRNLFYFQLIFQNGESGYVLANSQMTTDGFIAGSTSTFVVYSNSDMGDIVEVNIIPDDLDKNSDVLDKLYIEKIEIIRDNPNGIARRFICSDVGWITRDYHSNDETELKGQVIGRTKQELVCRYSISEKAWVLKYEVAITTGQTINTKYGQYNGPLKADITYETSSGAIKHETDFDVAAAMYEYNNKAPKKNDDNIVVVDPERMLRPETTDRFFINISDACQIKSIKFIAEGSSENANWTINNISISLVTSKSTLWINENDEYQMQYEKPEDPQLLVDRITNANLPSLFTIYGDVKNTKKFEFEENHIPAVDEYGGSISVATRVPQSHNDEFNIFIYLEKDKVEANGTVHAGAISPKDANIQIGTTIYYTGQYNDYKVNENKLKQTEIGDYHVMYALGISAEQFKSLQAVGVNTSQATSASVKANVPIAYAILQHIRGDVVCDTYYIQFGGSDPSILSGKSTASSVISSLATQGEYQTLDITFGNGTQPGEIIPMDQDIAVAVQYESFNIDGQSIPYWSPYIFLSDDSMELGANNVLSIDSGQNKKFKFNIAYVDKITAIKVVGTGGLKLSVDNALVNQYGFGEEGKIELLKTYGLNISDSGHMVKSGGSTYQTDQDKELTPVVFKFTVADPVQNVNVGTTKTVRLKVNYDSNADRSKKYSVSKSMEIANITGTGFEASQTKEVSVMLEDLKEIRNVQLIPEETLKIKSASYDIDGQITKTVLVSENDYIDENKPITINFADIVVRLNGITYKSNGSSVRSNETTDNGSISLAANPGEKFTLVIDVKNQLTGTDTSGFILKYEKIIDGAKSMLESFVSDKNSERIVYTVPDNTTATSEKYLFTVSSKESPDLKSTVELVVASKSNPIPDTTRDTTKGSQSQDSAKEN